MRTRDSFRTRLYILLSPRMLFQCFQIKVRCFNRLRTRDSFYASLYIFLSECMLLRCFRIALRCFNPLRTGNSSRARLLLSVCTFSHTRFRLQLGVLIGCIFQNHMCYNAERIYYLSLNVFFCSLFSEQSVLVRTDKFFKTNYYYI